MLIIMRLVYQIKRAVRSQMDMIGGLDEECERETEKEEEMEEEVEQQVPRMKPASEIDWDYESVLMSTTPCGLATTVSSQESLLHVTLCCSYDCLC